MRAAAQSKWFSLMPFILFFSRYSYGYIRSNSDQEFADKGLIQRVYESIMGVDTDKQDNNAVDNTSSLILKWTKEE